MTSPRQTILLTVRLMRSNCTAFEHGQTEDIPLDDVQKILPDYNLYQLFVDPAHAGHSAVSRARTYIFCCHKLTGEYLFDIWECYKEVSEQISMICTTRCRDYFVSDQRVRDVHSWQISRKRKVDWKAVTCLYLLVSKGFSFFFFQLRTV